MVKLLPKECLELALIFLVILIPIQSVPVRRDRTTVSGAETNLTMSDVFISVKTSGRFHGSRLPELLDTWYPAAAPHTWIVTDVSDPQLAAKLPRPDRLVVSDCGQEHARQDLSCKMEVELSLYLSKNEDEQRDWFCHVDDDNYLNTDRLLEVLNSYKAPRETDWYLGKASVPSPLELPAKYIAGDAANDASSISFWFATGGAGFCLSRHLARRMRDRIVGGEFRRLSNSIRLPDDVTVGYLMERLASVPLTHVAGFHSHLESLDLLEDPASAVTISYAGDNDSINRIDVRQLTNSLTSGSRDVKSTNDDKTSNVKFSQEDKSRFRALHCFLHPDEC